jgi:hypothetical protein
MPDRQPVIAGGIDRAAAANQIRQLETDFSNLLSWGTGPQPAASQQG